MNRHLFDTVANSYIFLEQDSPTKDQPWGESCFHTASLLDRQIEIGGRAVDDHLVCPFGERDEIQRDLHADRQRIWVAISLRGRVSGQAHIESIAFLAHLDLTQL